MNTPSVRPRWEDLPDAVRAKVQARLGSSVVEVSYPEGGFTPGLAVRLTCADRSEVFLKAADLALPMASHYRAEAVVGAHLPSVIAPELWWSVESLGWIVNAFEAVVGGEPDLRPGSADLPGVLDVVGSLERELTPCPVPVGEAGETLSLLAGHWERLAADAAGPDAWCAARRAWLTEMDDRDLLGRAAAGDTLVHCDLRADNMLMDAGRVRVLDWSWAARGAAWVDAAFFVPQLILAGHCPAGAEAERGFRRGGWQIRKP